MRAVGASSLVEVVHATGCSHTIPTGSFGDLPVGADESASSQAGSQLL